MRIIPVLLHKGHQLIKGKGFNSWRNVGHALQAIRVYQNRNVDELMVIDIEATDREKGPDFKLVESYADECMMPLTVGGGIRDVSDIRHLIKRGADKVLIGTQAYLDPYLVNKASERFGAQAITISIDYRDDGYVYINSGKVKTDRKAVEYAEDLQDRGAGEILLNSIPRDGELCGYDLGMIKAVSDAVTIPVIACGGCGTYDHMAEALRHGAHAVAAGAMFQFTEATPSGAAKHLKTDGFSVRMNHG